MFCGWKQDISLLFYNHHHLLFIPISNISRCSIFPTDPADVIVRMEQSSATVTEGDVVGSVCAELQALPVSGVEISVTISTTDLNAGSFESGMV